ncbi:MAG: NADH-quinone oxidoreductase subunit K [Candidatus Woesearchaeota archaeon]|nr:NADH-quinone oxidoreductase subunit K [Candidatus Woesearchaeota archaeon]
MIIAIAIILFGIGVYGVLARRDILRIIMSVAIMLGSITVLAVALGSQLISQSFVLFVWSVEVLEIILGLAIFLYLARHDTKDINKLQELKW